MERVSRRLNVENGELFALSENNRYLLFECQATIEIIETDSSLPILHKGRVITDRKATVLITYEQRPKIAIDPDKISGFEFKGDVFRSDFKYESMIFNNCILDSDLDLTDGSSCRFILQCSPDTLRRLETM